METRKDLEKLRDIYLRSLDDLENKDEDPWIEPDVLANITGTTTTQLSNVILNFDDFIQNSKGKISTRKSYSKRTSFFRKLKDSSTGIIE
jgi:hypothetical protein